MRTPALIERAVALCSPGTNKRYLAREIPGYGHSTFCNIFVRDALRLMGLQIPATLVNDLVPWFDGLAARDDGWRECSQLEANVNASLGNPTIACCLGKVHGHIALILPARGDGGVWIAQAGQSNFSRGTLARGFGNVVPRFFTNLERLTNA